MRLEKTLPISLSLTCALALTLPAFASATPAHPLDARSAQSAELKRHGADDPAGDDRGGQGGHDEPGDDRGGNNGGGGGGNSGGGNNGGGAARSRAGAFKFDPRSFTVNEGAGVARITIERSRGQRGAASVTVTATGGTATAGSDFTLASGVLSWAAGEGGKKTLQVAILDDAAAEGRETVQLALGAPTGGALVDPARGKSTLTILDNDGSKACVADASTACLASGRFQVEAEGLSSGRAGRAEVIASEESEGRFGFAGQEALQVRILDACAASGAFWVALDGRTGDDSIVKVTDTWTGLVRELVNTSGRPAETVWDTETFSCND